jgi:hypothetical protein
MMNFQEIEARYAVLRQQYDRRQISYQVFNENVNQLRTQGQDGAWWQMRAQDGVWLRWDGRQWFPTIPPHRVQPGQGVPAPAPARFAPAPAAPLAPSAARPRATGKPQKPPESLLDLLVLILRNMFKRFIVKLLFSFITLVFVWVIHTYLLVGPNGGFDLGSNPILNTILALRGRMASGTLFWGLLFGLLSMVIARTWQTGLEATIKNIVSMPRWLLESFRRAGRASWPLLLGNAAAALVLGTILNNRLVSLLLVFASLGALVAQNTSFPGVVLRLGWADTERLLKRKSSSYNPGWTAPAVAGLGLGFLSAVILPFVPYCGLGGAFVLLAVTGLLVFLLIAQPRVGALLLVLFLALFILIMPVLADDGGWQEAGGTLLSWLQSQGAVQAIVMGLPPALASSFLGWLAATLGQSLSTVYAPGIKDIKPADVVAAIPTALGLTNLQNSLEAINQGLRNENIYVRNMLQGDPVLIFQGWYNLGGIIWDNTGGYFTGAQGLTCEGYVDKTFAPVKTAVEAQFPGAKVQKVTFEEKSSIDPQTWGQSIDSANTENHILIKVTLPNGSEWAVDYHQHNAHFSDSFAPPIMRPWNEARQEWVNYLGQNEFVETVK